MKLLLENWRKYLKEEAEGEPTVSFGKLDNIFRIFHLSNIYPHDMEGGLGVSGFALDVGFTPRITTKPLTDIDGNVIEDNFTPRVSVGPTVQKCFDALHLSGEQSGYLYAADVRMDSSDDVKVFDLQDNFEKCRTKLSSDENEFGEDFRFQKYLNHTFNKEVEPGAFTTPGMLPDEYQIDWKGCVPDAMMTGENWLLQPTRMFLIGDASASGTVKLSHGVAQLLRSLEEWD